MKKYSVAIIGCGSRGHDAYGAPIHRDKEHFDIVALCDKNEVRLKRSQEDFEVEANNCFLSEDEFFAEKRADILVVATLDQDHVRMAVKAMKLGYHLLLEKPISADKAELEELLAVQKEYDRKVIVCHVLRYAPAFVKVKELLDKGLIGRLIRIESLEQVGWWHQAHSYVRGNWRKGEETTPMIMAKCCHDLDLLQYYANSKCKTVYSTGGLDFFTKENQPEGAADRCADCKYIHDCPYSAEYIYVERWKKYCTPVYSWPYNVIDSSYPNTAESLRKAYENGPYGRCVFACDNDVVDNQSVSMDFVNGVRATLTMTAFTHDMGRVMTFHGTHGEIKFNESEDFISLEVFGKDKEVMKVSEIISENVKDSFGHGGGDVSLIETLYGSVSGTCASETSLENSVESHLMAIAAEESRKTGKPINIR